MNNMISMNAKEQEVALKSLKFFVNAYEVMGKIDEQIDEEVKAAYNMMLRIATHDAKSSNYGTLVDELNDKPYVVYAIRSKDWTRDNQTFNYFPTMAEQIIDTYMMILKHFGEVAAEADIKCFATDAERNEYFSNERAVGRLTY